MSVFFCSLVALKRKAGYVASWLAKTSKTRSHAEAVRLMVPQASRKFVSVVVTTPNNRPCRCSRTW